VFIVAAVHEATLPRSAAYSGSPVHRLLFQGLWTVGDEVRRRFRDRAGQDVPDD
jgi:hypothetical protein